MNSHDPTPATTNASQEHDLLTGQALRTALGFGTGEAFRAAIRTKRIPVPLVKIAGRRGWFARAADVAKWRASLTKDFDEATKGEMP
ncbi:hypothetical protein [Polaromonas sp.]|uniref:hypothetical protein n=1 Tax=Polaromonas sp. TaxID=1869339 RepID=UPI003C8E8643